MMYSSLNSKVVVYDGFMKYIFADVIWFEFWMIGGYDSPDVINMNLKRISCNACLSAGRLSINDTDDRCGGPQQTRARYLFQMSDTKRPKT